MNIDGRCHCGAVTYRAEIDPARVLICHCTDCQMLTGSPYRATVTAPHDSIEITGAAPKVYEKTGGSGRKRRMYFCATCRSPVFSSSADGTGDWGIRWGSINQRDQLRPARQIWCRSEAPWVHDLAKMPGHPTE